MTTVNGGADWVPDARTVEWFVGSADERRIWRTLRSEVERRAVGMDPDTDEYWRLVAEIAVEHLVFDMVREARARGARVPITPSEPFPDDG